MGGRVAVVTGAGSGIGAASARLLARRGFAVALVGRRAHKLAEVARAVEGDGGRAMSIAEDVGEAAASTRIVDAVLGGLGRIDVLVNNAAAIGHGPFLGFDVADVDEHLAVNVRAPILLIQAALPALRESPQPCVVNVSSAAAAMHRPGSALYGTTKAALEHLTRSLAVELGPRGVRVNAVRPGPTETPIHARYTDDVDARYEALAETVPLGRIGTAEEVAWWVCALASAQAGWVNGAIVSVDGGRSLGAPTGV